LLQLADCLQNEGECGKQCVHHGSIRYVPWTAPYIPEFDSSLVSHSFSPEPYSFIIYHR
jgi:hypothetical protein